MPEPFRHVKLFADLSQSTLQARKRLVPITASLRQQNIMYRWGFPMKNILRNIYSEWRHTPYQNPRRGDFRS